MKKKLNLPRNVTESKERKRKVKLPESPPWEKFQNEFNKSTMSVLFLNANCLRKQVKLKFTARELLSLLLNVPTPVSTIIATNLKIIHAYKKQSYL